MPETIAEAFVAIRPDGSKFTPQLKADINKALNDTQGELDKFGKQATKLGKTLSLAITAPIAAFAAVGFSELADAGKVAAQTEAVIKSTGQAANVSAKQIDALGTALLRKSGIDDEAIKSGANLLLTFTKIRNETGKGNDIFNQATKAALNLSIAFGQDITNSAILVGKALQDPIQGITALRRVGVQLSDTQKEQIANFVALGDTMGAQKVILKELETQVGGSAAAYGKTMAGQVSLAKEELKNAAAVMISTAAPAIKALSGLALDLAGFLERLGPGARTAAGGFLVFLAALGPVMFLVGKLAGAATGIVRGISAMGTAAQVAVPKVLELASALRAYAAAQLLALGPIAVLLVVTAAILTFATQGAGAYERIASASKRWAESTILDAKRTGQELQVLKVQQKNLSAESDALTASTARLNRERNLGIRTNEETNRLIYANGLAILDLQKKHEGLTPEVKRLQQANKEAKAAEDARKVGIKALADGTKDWANATDDAKNAIIDLQATVLATLGGELGYQQSLLNLTRAQQNLDKVRGDSESTADDLRQAELDLEQARLGVASAALTKQDNEQKLLDIIHQGPDAVQAYVSKLKIAQDLYGDPGGKLQAEIDRVADLSAKINGLPPSKEFTFKARFEGDSAFLQAYGALTKDLTPDEMLVLSGHRASGGPVGPGNWMVGERGNGGELLTLAPGSSGYVTNAAQTEQVIGGDTYNVTYNLEHTRSDGLALAVETMQHLRVVQYAMGA